MSEFVVVSVKGGNVGGSISVTFPTADVFSAGPLSTAASAGVAVLSHFFVFGVTTSPIETWTSVSGYTLVGGFVSDESCAQQEKNELFLLKSTVD